MRSYVQTPLGVISRVREFIDLYSQHVRDAGGGVRSLLDLARQMEADIVRVRGRPLENARILEIGPGQQPTQLAYFGRDNDAVGIDLDLFCHSPGLRDSLRMLRTNGATRTIKTLGRKVLGIDRKVWRETWRQLRVETPKPPRVLQMDAAAMTFPAGDFDVVYSRSAFEHFPDPAAVCRQIVRVLKPGGVCMTILHLYTSDSGAHDSRTLCDRRAGLPYWAHLRPQFAALVRSNTYLNRLRLTDWISVYQSTMPGSRVEPLCDASRTFVNELSQLRIAGELADYSDEELLSFTVRITWQKPAE